MIPIEAGTFTINLDKVLFWQHYQGQFTIHFEANKVVVLSDSEARQFLRNVALL